jgi:hypothetical protein
MKIIENGIYDEERAFYGERGIICKGVKIDGPADGESAFKECDDVSTENCYFNLRYPFWHDRGAKISNCEMTSTCRAALWYSDNVEILDSKLHGIKALRECSDVDIKGCDVISAEFGWMSKNVKMKDCRAEGEYFMFRGEELNFRNLDFKGKYSFQYIKNATFENCKLDTKDAFWHAENVTVKNSLVKGEYLAWYSKNLTLENCKIIGTQPFCYCEDLKLINCEMAECDLAFEKSYVEASVTTHIDSIKNPTAGYIEAPSVGEIILDYDTSCSIRILEGANK